MKNYSREQIETLLRAIDENLNFRFKLIVIGGTAAALGYHVTRYTKDIDTVGSIEKIEAAYKKAIETTGLAIPLGPAGVEDGPYECESRLKQIKIPGLKHLTVTVLEKHDLVARLSSRRRRLEECERVIASCFATRASLRRSLKLPFKTSERIRRMLFLKSRVILTSKRRLIH